MLKDASLLYFFEVARTGSIRQAAEHLHISPSAVSRMIQKAEHQFGTPLFERRAGGMHPTAAGEVLTARLTSVFAQLRSAETHIAELAGLQRGEVSVHCIEGLVDEAMPNVITAFNAMHPGIRFSVRTAGSDEIVAALLADTADVGITFGSRRQAGVEPVIECEHRLCVVAAPVHPLARRRTVTLRELVRHPMAMPEPSFSVTYLLERALRARRIAAPAMLATNSIALCLNLARGGRFVTVTSPFAAGRYLRSGELKTVAIGDGGGIKGTLAVCKHEGRRLSAAATGFLSCLEAELTDDLRR